MIAAVTAAPDPPPDAGALLALLVMLWLIFHGPLCGPPR